MLKKIFSWLLLSLFLVVETQGTVSLDEQSIVKKFMSHVNLIEPDISYQNEVIETFKISYNQVTFDFTKFFEEQIEELSKNSEGNDLLKLACNLFDVVNIIRSIENKEVSFKETELNVTAKKDPSSFAGRISEISKDLELSLNLSLISENTFWHETFGLCTSISAPVSVRTFQNNLVYISECADPFWLLIAHELIHMTHFMQSYVNSFCQKYIFGIIKNENEINTEQIQIVIKQKLSELKSKFKAKETDFECIDTISQILKTNDESLDLKKLLVFFKNIDRLHVRYDYAKMVSAREFVKTKVAAIKNSTEEQSEAEAELEAKKAFSNFPELNEKSEKRQQAEELCDSLEERQTVIGSGISELTIRLAADLPIRYIYQAPNESTYEHLETIYLLVQQTKFTQKFENDMGISYINSSKNDAYFNTKLFYKKIDPKFLSDKLFEEFGLKQQIKQLQPFVYAETNQKLSRNLYNIKPETVKTILDSIGEFERKNLKEGLNKLFNPQNLSFLVSNAIKTLLESNNQFSIYDETLKLKRKDLEANETNMQKFITMLKSIELSLKGLQQTNQDVTQIKQKLE